MEQNAVEVFQDDDGDSDSTSSTVIISDWDEGHEHNTRVPTSNVIVERINSAPEVFQTAPSTSIIVTHQQNDSHLQMPAASPTPSTSVASVLKKQNDIQLPSAADAQKTENGKDPSVPETGLSQSYDDEGQTCPICFETWDNSGTHRLVALNCGHLFGFSCVSKWLKSNGSKCPQCKAKCRPQQIRVLYATCLKVRDTADLDRAKQELEHERETRRNIQLELMMTQAKYAQVQAELKVLKEKVKREVQNSPVKRCSTQSVQSSSELLSKERSIEISKEGNCRVLAYMDFMKVLVVSQPSMVRLYPGFGLKKVNVLDFRPSDYIPIHQKQIRDVCFGRDRLDGLVLTASIDKTVKLTSILSNSCVQTYNCEMAAWSCTWHASNHNQFFAGLCNGAVHMYDIRQTTGHVCKLPPTCSVSPVVSLQHTAVTPLSSLNCEGLIVGQLERCSFFEWMPPDEYKLHIFPFDGPVTAVSLEPTYQQLLISYRQNSHHQFTRHVVYELLQNELGVRCNPVETFFGGATQQLLAKGRLIQNPLYGGNLIGCVADESSRSCVIFDAKTAQVLQKLPADQPVLDMCPIKGQSHELFATLTERLLNVYRWR